MSQMDFRSDTVTQPTSAMREAMFSAPLGDDVFGDDPSINALQEHAATQLGFEAALFAPSGTQTNLIALMSHCARGEEALVGQQWHTYRWEAGGMAVLGSIQPQPIENQPDGSLRIEDLQAAIKPDDPHFAKTKLVVIENTTGGKPLTPAYMKSVAHFAKQNKLMAHIDGARLMNAAVAQASQQGNTTDAQCLAQAKQLCEGFDSLSLCLSKGLGAPVGSLLLGNREFIARAKRHRKMLGGGMRQGGFLAAAGLYALQHNVARLQEDHVNAQVLAKGLADLPFVSVKSIATNIVFIQVDAAVANDFAAHLAKHGVKHTGLAMQRWVTHLNVDQHSVAKALDIARQFKPH
jgi:threonine aldolase